MPLLHRANTLRDVLQHPFYRYLQESLFFSRFWEAVAMWVSHVFIGLIFTAFLLPWVSLPLILIVPWLALPCLWVFRSPLTAMITSGVVWRRAKSVLDLEANDGAIFTRDGEVYHTTLSSHQRLQVFDHLNTCPRLVKAMVLRGGFFYYLR